MAYGALYPLLEGDASLLSLKGVRKIPHAALSVEDAMMLKRMAQRHIQTPDKYVVLP